MLSNIQSNLCIRGLYVAVTLCITVTEQIPKNLIWPYSGAPRARAWAEPHS